MWARLVAYILLQTVMAAAAAGHGPEAREANFTGAKQAVVAIAPKLLAARPVPPRLQQAGGGDVPAPVAQAVYVPPAGRQGPIVLARFGQRVGRVHIEPVIDFGIRPA